MEMMTGSPAFTFVQAKRRSAARLATTNPLLAERWVGMKRSEAGSGMGGVDLNGPFRRLRKRDLFLSLAHTVACVSPAHLLRGKCRQK